MHIRKVTAADLPDYALVSAKAMWDDEIVSWTAPWRNEYPESYIGHFLHRLKRRFYLGQFLFIAVTDKDDPDWDGRERVIGYSGYTTSLKSRQQTPPSGWLGNSFEMLAWKCQDYISWFFKMDKSADQTREAIFRSTLATDTTFDHLPDHWELELLGVHPDFQRRGIGYKLLQFGFDQATKDQVPVVVMASLNGEQLYLKAGFKELSRVEVDPRIGVTWAAMVWEPPSNQTDQHESKV